MFSGFTLVEVLIALGILSVIMLSIYSTWTAILRASKVGLDAAASVQRTRIAVRNLEDSLVCVQSYAANQRYYGFMVENGDDATLSFVSRLPKSFPRSGKFGDLDVRRVTFSLENSQSSSSKQLVMRQSPVMMGWDEDEKNHPLVLARFVKEFKIELADPRNGEWIEEWVQTNQLPKLVKITLQIADNERTMRKPTEIVRHVNLPSSTVQVQWQRAVMPGQPLPGQPPGQPGQLPPPGGVIQPVPSGPAPAPGGR
jgi:type II secretion system protein J